MKMQYMSDLHMEFQENSRYLKNDELPANRWGMCEDEHLMTELWTQVHTRWFSRYYSENNRHQDHKRTIIIIGIRCQIAKRWKEIKL